MPELLVMDAAAAAELVAGTILDLVDAKPDAVLGVATGSTPLPLYRSLARRIAGHDWSRVHAFALDEYLGLPPGHPQSYRMVLERELLRPLGLADEQLTVPPAHDRDLVAACAGFEERIRAAGGVDLQILGLGSNGHIGFNEPGAGHDSRTRVEVLTEGTRADNARFFASPAEVPTRCVTQGIGTIMEARRVVLLAAGPAKARALAAALDGPVTPRVPASALRRHPGLTVVADGHASALLAGDDGPGLDAAAGV